MIRIVLAEDLNLVRQGLRALLEASDDLHVVGEAGDGIEALRLVERLRPTVLVTDVAVRRLCGFDLAREVRQRHPETRVVMLSVQSSRRYLQEALANGATGYVLKSAQASELVDAVRRVATGQRYVSAPLADGELEERGLETRVLVGDAYHVLTAREREVLALAAEGRTNAAVGAELGISPRTVEVHRANLMRKLGLRSQTELVREALRRGILPPD